jgi:hypothetical protein
VLELAAEAYQDLRPRPFQGGQGRESKAHEAGQHDQRGFALARQDAVVDLHHVKRQSEQAEIDEEAETDVRQKNPLHREQAGSQARSSRGIIGSSQHSAALSKRGKVGAKKGLSASDVQVVEGRHDPVVRIAPIVLDPLGGV